MRYQAGECLSVCAACGARVRVAPVAGIAPTLHHAGECPREDWPILDAIAYGDGLAATVNDWPNGIEHGGA